MRVRIALKEILSNKSTLLLKMNPVHKQVPVLIHNGKPVSESLIIVEYIDEVWKNKVPLLPSDPCDRANARFWANYVDSKIFNIGKLVWATKGEVQEAAKKELIECFKQLEMELGERHYFGGKNIGLVDIPLIPFYSWFYALEMCGNLSIIHECAKLVSWARRCMEKQSVSASLPDQYKVYDHILELRD
ncbi:hypothetical protein Leryth_006026 [Lithospermum erythrorhizon]|nr:hypothetical protein Leryth_006026 [Lithospermum erythrorhizon]